MSRAATAIAAPATRTRSLNVASAHCNVFDTPPRKAGTS